MQKFGNKAALRSTGWNAAVLALLVAIALVMLPAWALAGDSSERSFDVRLGQRLYPLASERGGAELRLSRSESKVMRHVFDELASEARRQYSLPYSLHVTSSTAKVDAWAYPDGSVWVTMGLVRAIRQETEFAGIIAHQLAHAALRLGVRAVASPEAQTQLRALADGKISPKDRSLGKIVTAVAGEYTTATGEAEADSLAAVFLRRAGYSRDGLQRAWGRLVAQDPKSPVLRSHPHPDVKPWTEPESGSMVIVITSPPGAAPAPPVPYVPGGGGIAIVPSNPAPYPPPVVSPATPPVTVSPEGSARPARERRSAFGVTMGFGAYPLPFESKAVNLTYDDGVDDYTLTLTQRDKEATGVFRMDFETVTAGGTTLGFGGGGGVSDVFANKDLGLFFLEGGVGQQIAKSDAANLTIGAFVTGAWLSGRVYTVEAFGDPDLSVMQVGDAFIPAGTAVNAEAGVVGAGVRAKASGTLARGVQWHASVQYHKTTKDDFQFTATDEFGQRVAIPFTGAGPDSGPDAFAPSGFSYSLGVGFRF